MYLIGTKIFRAFSGFHWGVAVAGRGVVGPGRLQPPRMTRGLSWQEQAVLA